MALRCSSRLYTRQSRGCVISNARNWAANRCDLNHTMGCRMSLPGVHSKAQTRNPKGLGVSAPAGVGGSMGFAKGMKTIVVATDLTGQSEAALEYARKLAGGYGARIVLAHGTDPVEYAAVDSVPGRVLRGMTE